ncbi:MAG TPA: S8 family serine peptidase [Hyalangium sp.]|nr:S8 family serine peptidase [Hyalangium sp.]
MSVSTVAKLAMSGMAVSLLMACPKNPTDPNPNPNPCPTGVTMTAAQAAQEKFVTVDKPIAGEFIVVLKETPPGSTPRPVQPLAQQLSTQYGGTAFTIYEHALRGFASKMTEDQAKAMSNDGEVAYVQQNQEIVAFDTQSNATWGLDRIDQRDLPLDKTYSYNVQGKGVHAYIIDTGIRVSHSEFEGRADVGFDAINDGQKGNDCNGHGTHVAGTVGGRTWGVAKNVLLHAVRVLSCSGSGSTAGVVAGIDWVTANKQLPAVANMSLGGGADRALDDAVRKSVAGGVVYTLAAGNDNRDACSTSPARTAEGITVGATTTTDARASFSNYGGCVDIFTPGHNITSAWHTSDADNKTISGTSMAAPHAAGIAALYLGTNPNASPNDVAKALLDNSTPSKVTSPGTCSPNKLGFMGFIAGGEVPSSPPSAQ